MFSVGHDSIRNFKEPIDKRYRIRMCLLDSVNESLLRMSGSEAGISLEASLLSKFDIS